MLITRRSFLSGVGKVGLLVGTASAMHGVSFLAPRAVDGVDVSADDKPGFDYQVGVCVLGVGSIGMAITKLLLLERPKPGLPVLHMDRHQALVSRVLASSHLAFLAGSVKEPALDVLRTLAADVGVGLVVLFEDVSETSGVAPSRIHGAQECIVPINGRADVETAAVMIADIYGALALPGLVCLDFADVREVLARKFCRVSTVSASDIGTGIKTFRSHSDLIRTLSRSDSALTILSTDHARQEPVESYIEFNEEMERHVHPDTTTIWCANVLGSVPQGFRMTVITALRATHH